VNALIGEVVGTLILILLGNGVVSNVLLKKTSGNGAGWIVITAGWGIAVFVGATIANAASGAHLNPAVTIAKLALGDMSFSLAIGYMLAQMLGAILGAMLVYLFYRSHFQATESASEKLSCFCTAPSIPGNGQALLCEMIGTFVLVYAILHFQNPLLASGSVEGGAELGLGSIGLLQVAFVVFGIGLSLGGTTGYAINPARDLGPRIAHALLPMENKGDSDWGYAIVPVMGPLLGGVLAAIVYSVLL
jgi:glycerol uptake facilitator protein